MMLVALIVGGVVITTQVCALVVGLLRRRQAQPRREFGDDSPYQQRRLTRAPRPLPTSVPGPGRSVHL